MKMLAVAAMVIFAAFTATFAAGYRNVDSGEVQKLLKSRANVLLVDVRTPGEYGKAHLRGAKLIPLDDLARRVGEIPRQRPVVVYCTVGARSRAAAELLAGKSYPEVYNMSDGIIGWYRHGFPIEQ